MVGGYYETVKGHIIKTYHAIARWDERGTVVDFECMMLAEDGNKYIAEYRHDGTSDGSYGDIQRELSVAESERYYAKWVKKNQNF